MKRHAGQHKIRFSFSIFLYREYIPWLTALLFLNSCEKIIDYPVPAGELKLVINGIINTDSSVAINLSRSIPVLDTNSAPYIEDARVSLYEDNRPAGMMTYQKNGFYVLPMTTPVLGTEYSIVVTASDGTEVSSACIIPEPVSIIAIDTLLKRRFDEYNYGSLSYECAITADDPADVPNYYEIKLYHKSALDTIETKVPQYFCIDDPIFEFYALGIDIYPLQLDLETSIIHASSAFFSDDLIDGKRFTVRFSFEGWNPAGTYYICLRSLTRDYYLYLKSLLLYNMAQDNPLVERVQVHTNIINGLGIFGGYSTSTDSLSIMNPTY